MEKIWVRNINTHDIDKVDSLNYGSDQWQEAYSEMIERGYRFQIGNPKGNYNQCWGLYLINPLDIQIKQSEYHIVNKLNKEIKELQDSINASKLAEEQKKQNNSLIDLFKKLEGAYERARFNSGAAMMFAPSEAIESTIKSQEEAYNQFIEAIKVSSPEDINSILNMVFASSSLTKNAKLAIALEIKKMSEELLPKQVTIINKDLIDCFKKLEGAYGRARFNSGAAMMFAPSEAIDGTIKSQEEAYNQFIEAIKVSSPEDINSILNMVFASSSLTENAKLAIVLEIFKLLGVYTLKGGNGVTR